MKHVKELLKKYIEADIQILEEKGCIYNLCGIN